MSVKHIGLVLDHLEAPAAVKLVALILADHADSDGICWPSYQRIAERSCLAERTVRRYIHQLIDAGVIAKVRTGGVVTQDNQRVWVTNLYRIDAEALAAKPSLLKVVTEGHLGAKVAAQGHVKVVADGQARWSYTATEPPQEQPRSRALTVNPPLIPPPRDVFGEQFWTIWPNAHGSKKLARFRFNALSEADKERCLVAAGHYAAAASAGLVDVAYQPRAENFIGGSKAYWREWQDGPPVRYRNGSIRRDVSAADLLAFADRLESEEGRT